MSDYTKAMEVTRLCLLAAVRAAGNEDGAPEAALRDLAAEFDSLMDHGVTRSEMRSMRALYDGAKAAGLVG